MSLGPLQRFTAACLVVAAFAPMPVLARDRDHDNGKHGNSVAAETRLSAEQASAIVRGAYGGRVVSVKSAGDGYSVRVLLDGGRVKNVYVDGNGRLHE
jgi:uncharacterized membrane protein YkoI